VVEGYTGRCNDDAARAGIEWMRQHCRAAGQRRGFNTVRQVRYGLGGRRLPMTALKLEICSMKAGLLAKWSQRSAMSR
jgi:hypothetical protein